MSLDYWNRLKHLSAQVDALKQANDALAERVLALEAQPPVHPELDVDTLAPVKRGPGRPRKVQPQ